MAMIGRLFLSLTLVLSLTLASGSRGEAAPVEPASRAGDRITAEELASLEAQLVREIDSQADQLFQAFKRTNPTAPLGFLKKSQKQLVLRMKQMGVLADFLKASGKAPAITMLAGMILVDCVVVPILAVTGHPVAAGLVYSVPWGSFGGAGVFGYLAVKARRQLARDLNVESLKAADAYRKALIGYDVKHRLFKTLMTTLEGTAIEFEVLRKALAPEPRTNSTLSIPELQTLIASTAAGARYLEAITLNQLDPSLYAALLLRFIADDPELVSSVVELLKSRPQRVMPQASQDMREVLTLASEIQAELQRETKRVAKRKSALIKKRLHSFDWRGVESKDEFAHLNSEFDRLQSVRKEASLAEYAMLVQANSQEAVAQRREELIKLRREARYNDRKTSQTLLCRDSFAAGF